jgi:hypothetical protein
MRIGLLSDTHGRFDPALPRLFARCDRILHAGDVVGPEILHQLAALAPLTAVRGNNDVGAFGSGLEEVAVLRLEELKALVVHQIGRPDRMLDRASATVADEGADLVVFGHSHEPHVSLQAGRLFVNPGSAGPRRFKLPRVAGLALIERRRVRVELYDLDSKGLTLLFDPWEGTLQRS